METLGSNFEYRQIPSIPSNTGYCEYNSFLFTTPWIGNHMGTHQTPLDTFGNPEYSNYLLFKRFLRRTRSSNKRWRPQTICSRASIVFIRTNPVKIQIYQQLLLTTLDIWRYLNCQHQIPNTVKYRQILYRNWPSGIVHKCITSGHFIVKTLTCWAALQFSCVLHTNSLDHTVATCTSHV